MIGERHLSIEDSALIDEDGEGVADAREEPPGAIPVRNSKLILLSLVNLWFVIALFGFWDGAGPFGDALKDGEHEKGEVTPSEQGESFRDRSITDEACLSCSIHKPGAGEKSDVEKWMTTRKPVTSKRI